MSVDLRYIPMLEAIVTTLQSVAPTRTVTRVSSEFANRDQLTMAEGIFLVLPGSVRAYDYEVSDNQSSDNGLRATAQGRLAFTISGQQYLGESATGLDVDAAEFAMLADLESLVDEAVRTEGLQALLLKSVEFSGQVETPWARITSSLELFSLN